jgi:two-component system NarL family response regulator
MMCECAASHLSVLIVDPSTAARRVVSSVLGRENDLRIVGLVSSPLEGLKGFRTLKPDLVVLDLVDVDAIDLVQRIRRASSHTLIVMLARLRDEARARRALTAGAQAYVLKSLVRQDLVKTIRLVHRHRDAHHPHIQAPLPQLGQEPLLSAREIEVLSLVATGNTNRIIGARLAMSEETAKGHLKNILSKLHAKDRTHAVVLALRLGILRLS